MKKLLMIANQYPPMGGSGVQRSSKFAKYLPEYGIEPIVLTQAMDQGLTDKSLLLDIGEHVIVRTKAYDCTQWSGPFSLLGKVIGKFLMVPDSAYLWHKKAFRKAKRLIEENNIEIIYSTSYPYSDHLLGLKLKEVFPQLPWVVDFRDEWTKNPYILDMHYPLFRRKIEKKMEEKVVGSCDAFITNTHQMLQNFTQSYQALSQKAYVIPNGYDDTDFNQENHNHVYTNVFRVIYTGAMYGRRRPDKVFQAVRQLLDAGIIKEGTLELIFIGHMDMPKVTHWIKVFDLEKEVTCHGYMPHKKAIQALSKADVLLLLIGEGKGSENFSSGKIFEYINCNRPILGVVPKKGAAAEVINQTKSGIVCDTGSVEAIGAGIQGFYEDWKNKTLIRPPDWLEIKKYHRKVLTEALNQVIEFAESQVRNQ